MARIGVTLTDVSDAASRLILEGKTPTVAQVRKYLGTGSNTTISRHLRTWRSNNHSRSKNLLSENMPETLIPTIESLWNTALHEAECNFKEKQDEWLKSQQALQSMTDDFESELNLALRANELLKSEIDKIRNDYRQIEREYEELKSDFRQFKISATKKIKSLEETNSQLKRL